jgi:hypothetical protein
MLPILKNGGAPLLIPSIGRSPQSLLFAHVVSAAHAKDSTALDMLPAAVFLKCSWLKEITSPGTEE